MLRRIGRRLAQEIARAQFRASTQYAGGDCIASHNVSLRLVLQKDPAKHWTSRSIPNEREKRMIVWMLRMTSGQRTHRTW